MAPEPMPPGPDWPEPLRPPLAVPRAGGDTSRMPLPEIMPELYGRTVQWRPLKGKRRSWGLVVGGRDLATVSMPKLFGNLAIAETPAGRWTFKRVGVFRQVVTVRRPDEEENLATMARRWGKESLLECRGRRFTWRRESFWGRRWSWVASDGSLLVGFKTRMGFRYSATVEVSREARRYEDTPLLLVLGWYLIVLQAQEAAAAAAAG